MGVIDHLKHRLNPKTIAKEIGQHLADKTIPQGSGEVANMLFSGSAYSPLPGNSNPQPEANPAAEPEPTSYESFLADASTRGTNRSEGLSR